MRPVATRWLQTTCVMFLRAMEKRAIFPALKDNLSLPLVIITEGRSKLSFGTNAMPTDANSKQKNAPT